MIRIWGSLSTLSLLAPLFGAALALLSCGSQANDGPQPLPAPMSAAAPRLGSWRILGPGGGGAQYNPLPSPHDKSTILVSTDMTGCFVTHDGGASWRMFYLRWTCTFAYDPKNPDIYYATAYTSGLYRSADRGKTWQMIFPEAKSVEKLWAYEDEAELVLRGKMDGREQSLPAATAVVVHPEDSNLLYLAAGSHLWQSRNGGKSWDTLDRSVPLVRRIWIDPRPGVKKRLLLLQGINRLAYFDGRFQEIVLPGKVTRIYDTAMVYPEGQETPVLFLAASGVFGEQRRMGVLFVSRDLGKIWEEHGGTVASLGAPGAGTPIIRAIGTTPANPSVVYLSYSELVTEKDKPASHGVARSDNGGQSFRLVWQESVSPASNIHDPWLSEVYGPEWGENPLNLAVHPKDPDYIVATDLGRTMKSMDGGKTWHGLYSKRLAPDRWTSTGLDVLNCYGVHFDPFQKGRILASCTDLGLFRSEDRGSTWRNSWKGVPRAWRNTMYWAEFDPETPGLVWGAASRYHDLPRARTFRNFNAGNFKGGMVISRDSGQSWEPSSEGLPDVPITHFVVDWKSPKTRRTLWATAMHKGVYRSDDGGRTWSRKSEGISSAEPNAWRLHLDAKGALYLTIARRTPRSEPDTPSIGALYRSLDRGESWQPVALPAGVNGPTDLLSDPQDPNRLYLTAWPRHDEQAKPVKVSGGGLYLSTDRGATWRTLLSDPQHMYSISADYAHPGRLYATGFGSAVFRSDDRGETWRRLRGFNFRLGHRVIPDAHDPSRIYVTTMGGSLWHGPAEGGPEGEPEDITAPAPLRFDYPRSTR